MSTLPTPLSVELEENSELERELRRCREEILRLVEHYEELRLKQAATQQAIAEMRKGGMRQWPA